MLSPGMWSLATSGESGGDGVRGEFLRRQLPSLTFETCTSDLYNNGLGMIYFMVWVLLGRVFRT